MNWKALILDLRRAGLTQAEIGQAIGLSQPAVSDLVRARTRTMQWDAGDALIALHAQRSLRRGTSSSDATRPSDMHSPLIPFAIGVDANCVNVEILSGRNRSRLAVPVGDLPLLIAALKDFDPQSSPPGKHCLDLCE